MGPVDLYTPILDTSIFFMARPFFDQKTVTHTFSRRFDAHAVRAKT